MKRTRREMERLSGHWHADVRDKADRALWVLDHAERLDPRPRWWLSVRLALAGVRDAW